MASIKMNFGFLENLKSILSKVAKKISEDNKLLYKINVKNALHV